MMLDFESVRSQTGKTMDAWKHELNGPGYEVLCAKPDAESWSLGQVVMHLIDETNWYLEQIDECLKTNQHTSEGMRPEIEKWFEQNSFPNKRFKGPPDLPTPPQPSSKEALLHQFDDLREKIRQVGMRISNNERKGKTQHPGHGYFSAKEWFQYAEMHMRHHFELQF